MEFAEVIAIAKQQFVDLGTVPLTLFIENSRTRKTDVLWFGNLPNPDDEGIHQLWSLAYRYGRQNHYGELTTIQMMAAAKLVWPNEPHAIDVLLIGRFDVGTQGTTGQSFRILRTTQEGPDFRALPHEDFPFQDAYRIFTLFVDGYRSGLADRQTTN